MTCPQCGGEVEQVRMAEGGCIEETVWTKGGLRRKVRPATFYACTACEYCSERRPADQEEFDTAANLDLSLDINNPQEA